MTVTYRNTKTGRITHLAEASPLMDRSTRWVRVLGDTEPVEPTDPVDAVEPGAGAEQEGAAPAPFQPDAHTVAEVLAHLEDVDADERQRVLDAEAAGKGRRGILGG